MERNDAPDIFYKKRSLCECTKTGIFVSDKRKKNHPFLVECRNHRSMDFIFSFFVRRYDKGVMRIRGSVSEDVQLPVILSRYSVRRCLDCLRC